MFLSEKRRLVPENWEQIRAAGFGRFLLFYGAFFTVQLAVVGLVVLILRDPSDWRFGWLVVGAHLREALIFVPLGALAVAALTWPLSERSYQRWVGRGRPVRSERRRRAFSALQWTNLGFILGLALGAFLHHIGQARMERFLYTMGTASLCGTYAELQYKNASFELAKRALLEEVRCHERLVASRADEVDPLISSLDIGLTYGRLSLLETAYGDPQESARYMALARKELASSGWRDTSDEHIVAALQKIDQWVPGAEPAAR
ncbi:MAG: hypothetical protein U0X73_07925 [Thermoanaerobaculia bacterium]